MKKSAAMKIGLGAAAAVALTLGGMTPAFAATIPVGPDQVAPVEIGGNGTDPDYNYHEWHIGSKVAGTSPSFNFDNPAGITLLPRSVSGTAESTQLFKGNHISTITDATLMDASEFGAFLDGVSVVVAEGAVHLQIAGELNGTWTTLRPVAPHGTASATNALLGAWQGTSSATSNPRPLSDFLTTGTRFQLYGVGVVSDAAPSSVVSSITFGGNTYDFTTPAPGAETPPTEEAPIVAPTPPAKIDTAA